MEHSPIWELFDRDAFNVPGEPMSKSEMTAGEWIRSQGHGRGAKRKTVRSGQKNCGKKPREIREGTRLNGETIPEFVRRVRSWDSDDCLLVPGSQRDVPAQVNFCGRTIAAARYMALLTHGTPKSEGMVTRHLCGNGHLSCVNPKHVVWGTPGDNISDANLHRKCETAEEKIQAVLDHAER